MGTSRARELNAAPLADWASDGRQALIGFRPGDHRRASARRCGDFGVWGVAGNRRQPGCGCGKVVDVRGGVRVTVGGAVPASAVERWRAGRVVRMPVLLRQSDDVPEPGRPG